MKMNRIAAAAAAAALMTFAATGFAEPATPAAPANTGTIVGTIKDVNGKPAVGVKIAVNLAPGSKKTADGPDGKPDKPKDKKKREKGTGLMATTDDKGEFKIADVPAGVYVLIASAKEQGRARMTVTVQSGKEAPVNLQLTPSKKRN